MATEKLSIIVTLKDKALKGVDKLKNRFSSLAKAGVLKAGIALTGLTLLLKKVSNLASVQEDAINSLNAAMKNNGTFTEEASIRAQNFASELQNITTFGDEAIISAQGLLVSLAGLSGKGLEQATIATADLASRLGLDLNTAAQLVGKSLGSSTNALSRYGIEVTGAVGSSERLNSLVQNTAILFGGAAAAEADTYSGSIKQLKNVFGDLLESIGAVVNKALKPFVKKLTESLKFLIKTPPIVKKIIGVVALLTTGVVGLTVVFGTLAIAMNSAFFGLPLIIAGVTTAIAGVTVAAVTLTKKVGGFAGIWIKITAAAQTAFAELLLTLETTLLTIRTKFQNTFLRIKGLFKNTSKEIAANNKTLDGKIAKSKKKFMDKLFAIDDKLLKFKADNNKKEEEAKKKTSKAIVKVEKEKNEKITRAEKKAAKEREELQKTFASNFRSIVSAGVSPEGIDFGAMGRAIQQSLIDQLIAWAAAETAKAIIGAPLSFGGTLLALAPIAAGLASGIAAIQAVKFQDGGIVPGTSFSGDKVFSGLNSGEMVLNKGQQSNLFAMANGQRQGGGANVTINFSGPVLGDVQQAKEFAVKIDEELFKLKRNNQSVLFA